MVWGLRLEDARRGHQTAPPACRVMNIFAASCRSRLAWESRVSIHNSLSSPPGMSCSRGSRNGLGVSNSASFQLQCCKDSRNVKIRFICTVLLACLQTLSPLCPLFCLFQKRVYHGAVTARVTLEQPIADQDTQSCYSLPIHCTDTVQEAHQ